MPIHFVNLYRVLGFMFLATIAPKQDLDFNTFVVFKWKVNTFKFVWLYNFIRNKRLLRVEILHSKKPDNKLKRVSVNKDDILNC